MFHLAPQSERHRRPYGGVRVLPAVLADAGHVPLDVPRLQIRRVEGRVEQLDEPGVAVDQVLVDRPHGLGGARPGLRPLIAPPNSG